MNDLLRRNNLMNWTVIVLLTGLFLFGNLPIMIITYSYLAVIMLIRTWLSRFGKGAKIGLSIHTDWLRPFRSFSVLWLYSASREKALYITSASFSQL